MTNNAINAPNVNHGLFVGTGAGSYTGVAIGTSGEALVSAGSSADPAFGVVQPVGGGTGQSSLDAHSVIIGEGTSPVAFADPTGFVTGNPLVSQGSGNDPVFSDTATVTQITIIDTPVNPDDGVPKFYVDLIAAGFSFKQACFAASTTAFIANYSNGASGVGATLTNNSTLDAFSVDGTSPSLNDRILIKDQAAALQNGIYTLTTVGDNVTPWVLTRAIDYDSSAEITPGSLVAVLNGTVNAATFWVQTDVVNTVGTDPIEFVQFGFSPSDFLLRVNNLSDLDDATTARANLGLTNVAIQNVTQYNTLVGGASDSITSITPGSAGDLYVSTGASSDPNFITPTAGTGLSLNSDGTTFEYSITDDTIDLTGGANITVNGSPVPLGGSASISVSGTTDHAVQVGNVSGSLTSLGVGTAGQVLTSNGPGNDPSFQDGPSYSKGSWTPVLQGTGGSAGSQAYSSQVGQYVKVGDQVTVWFNIVLTNKGSWTGAAFINGLPYPVDNTALPRIYVCGRNLTFTNTGSQPGILLVGFAITGGGVDIISLQSEDAFGGALNQDYSDITNSSVLLGCITYIAA